MLTWLTTGLCFKPGLFKSFSIWRWLKLEIPMDFTSPSSTSSSMACRQKRVCLLLTCAPKDRVRGTFYTSPVLATQCQSQTLEKPRQQDRSQAGFNEAGRAKTEAEEVAQLTPVHSQGQQEASMEEESQRRDSLTSHVSTKSVSEGITSPFASNGKKSFPGCHDNQTPTIGNSPSLTCSDIFESKVLKIPYATKAG